MLMNNTVEYSVSVSYTDITFFDTILIFCPV